MQEELIKRIGYQFNNSALLNKALTHRSKSEDNNERLEFLGDSVVNFVIAEVLYERYPDAPEGDLTRWRATLINRETLAQLARHFDLGQFLFLGSGEQKSGGNERLSILSCSMEAIIGAIYLDGGFDAIKKCVLRWYAPLLDSLSSAASHKDPKSHLQEYLQSKHFSLPLYVVENVAGEAHKQHFTISCTVDTLKEKTIGEGSSRRRAEQQAAELMLAKILAGTAKEKLK